MPEEVKPPAGGEPPKDPPVDHRKNFDAWYDERRKRERDEADTEAKKKADAEEDERKKKGDAGGDHSSIAPRTPAPAEGGEPPQKRKHAGSFW